MPSSQTPSVDLAIHNDMAELGIVTDALDRIGIEAAVPGRIVTQLQVALDELLSNIIKYAWPEGGSHELHVHIGVQLGEIQVVIVDDGKPFDPRGEAGPASPQPGREPRAGGLGIHMVKQLVDRLDYARIDGRNRVTLVKQYISGATPRQDGRQ